jgi:hypothetical protein
VIDAQRDVANLWMARVIWRVRGAIFHVSRTRVASTVVPNR